MFQVNLAGAAPLHFAINLFGFSYTSWNGVPLPWNLAVVGAAPTCELSSSGEIISAFISNFGGAATQTIQIPGSLSLVGATVYSAWVVLDQTAPGNPAGYVSTNSLATLIGL